MSSVQSFYDELAESYHLIFEDWDRSIARQGAALAGVLRERWDIASGNVLDAAVGIGTQALGLAARNFHVMGSDVSLRALARTRREAAARQLAVPVVAADFRNLPFRDDTVDAVIVCDNALPHLLSLHEIRRALVELQRCVRPRGAFVLSMRDYTEPLPEGTVERRPYGERVWNGRRYFAEQEWHWDGPTYRVVLRIRSLEDDSSNERIEVATTYLAVPISAILELMTEVGFDAVERIDDVYYQPLLLGTAPPAA